MLTIDPITAPQRDGQDPTRRTALVTGVLFVITFVTSIPVAFYLYTPVLKHSDYIVGAGADTQVTLGALLEVILVIANIGTAIALFPLLKRQHEGLALGFVAARIVESVLIVIGILSVLTIVSLRQDLGGAAGADATSLITAGRSLVAVHDWTFLLGPGLTVGLGNGLMLGYLMYRSHLVPRRMAVLGLVGGPLILVSGVAVLFGVYEQVSAPSALATIPEFFWELGLGVYLIVKGFRPSAAARLTTVQPPPSR
ncbi:MAG: DUF4386 domain-containing protein [Kineosporiaceae bacterium]